MKLLTVLPVLLWLSLHPVGVAQDPPDSDACKFKVSGTINKITVTGPDEIVPLVYIVDQPDSPIEIVSIGYEGSWVSIYNERYTKRIRCKVRVRNRSDRHVTGFEIGAGITSGHGLGGDGVIKRVSLSPGQEMETNSCGTGGGGGAPGNRVRIVVAVELVDFGSCEYRPSVRIPREVGVRLGLLPRS